jgi:hypothetical protein
LTTPTLSTSIPSISVSIKSEFVPNIKREMFSSVSRDEQVTIDLTDEQQVTETTKKRKKPDVDVLE